MDTSIEYVQMCRVAKEIQLLKHEYFDHQCFFYNFKNDQISWMYDKLFLKFEHFIWLPRLDQLAIMWKNWNQNYSMAFFEEMVANSTYYPIELSNCPVYKKRLCLPTLEQHVLCRIMWGNYHKIWDEELKVWYTTEERMTPEEKAERDKREAEFKELIKNSAQMG